MNLPNVFQNKNIINKRDEQDIFYGNKIKEEEKQDVNKVINDLFLSRDFIYKSDVIIKTSDEDINATIVGHNKNYLITMDNKLIPIKNIISIHKKKKS